MRFIKFLFHGTLHLVWLRATRSGVLAGSGWRTHSIYFGPYSISMLTQKQCAVMVMNSARKHIHTHIYPLYLIILPLAGCYWASKWQMLVSSSPEKNTSPSWKWNWRVQTFKDAIKAFFLPTAMVVTLGLCHIPHWHFNHKASLTRGHYIQ